MIFLYGIPSMVYDLTLFFFGNLIHTRRYQNQVLSDLGLKPPTDNPLHKIVILITFSWWAFIIFTFFVCLQGHIWVGILMQILNLTGAIYLNFTKD